MQILQISQYQNELLGARLNKCFNGTKTSYVSKINANFNFSCHGPFKLKDTKLIKHLLQN